MKKTQRDKEFLIFGFLIIAILLSTVIAETSIINSRTATSNEEEYYYKILCALTTPSMLNFKYGAFVLLPTETIYSCFYIYVRFANLSINYVDIRSPPTPLFSGLQRFTTSDVITGKNRNSSILYVNESSILTINNAKDLWFRRMAWIMNTAPERLIIENVSTAAYLNISIGQYGSLISQYIGSAYKLSVGFTVIGEEPTQFRQVVTNTEHLSGKLGVNDPWTWCQGQLLLPLKSVIRGGEGSIDSDRSLQWYCYVNHGNQTDFIFHAYGMWYKYDLPSWWI
jgi:hypothetical protein